MRYLNALAFHLHLDKTGLELMFGVPTELNAALQQGELDASLISVTALLEHGYNHLPLGIAAAKEVLSVNLYAKHLHAPIAITSESSASVALLKVLCKHVWKVDPHFIPLKRPYTQHEAFLLIGDEALLHQKFQGYQTIDLAKTWYELTQLPFVFGVFAYRTPLDAARFERALDQCEEKELVETAHRLSHLPTSLLKKYYRALSYRLDEKHLQAIELFSELCTASKSPSL